MGPVLDLCEVLLRDNLLDSNRKFFGRKQEDNMTKSVNSPFLEDKFSFSAESVVCVILLMYLVQVGHIISDYELRLYN